MTSRSDVSEDKKVRYAVVGLGHIAQAAVLPAFRNAENSRLVGLVSGDATKRYELQHRYAVSHARGYEHFETLLRESAAEAVYIALPNHAHAEFTIRAAEAGMHVLCEKPMAVTPAECRAMIDATRANGVRLMIAYRLHFDKANLAIIEDVAAGDIGEPKIFQSAFTQVVQAGNVRLEPVSLGGGSAYDMGIYCINAARYLFRDEPIEVSAFTTEGAGGYDESMSAILRFSSDRLATFTSSFGAHRHSQYTIIGTKGRITLDPAYDYAKSMRYLVAVEQAPERIYSFPKRDQFAAELVYFSDCILQGLEPEPNGIEGLTDVQIIRALHTSAGEGRSVRPSTEHDQPRPRIGQAITRPGIEKPEEIHASAPSEPD